jgi:hypothetical protein
VHLSFGPRSAEPEIQEEAPEGRDPLKEGISATLESMRRQIEEGAGKVQPPPPPPGSSRRPGRTRRWSKSARPTHRKGSSKPITAVNGKDGCERGLPPQARGHRPAVR